MEPRTIACQTSSPCDSRYDYGLLADTPLASAAKDLTTKSDSQHWRTSLAGAHVVDIQPPW
ncbi:hypothetical protein LPJ71_006837, partial [Coemansia sp. S17]